MPIDLVLEKLHLALEAAAAEPKSRELSLVVTKIEEAVLWRQRDLQMKEPHQDLTGPVPGA